MISNRLTPEIRQLSVETADCFGNHLKQEN